MGELHTARAAEGRGREAAERRHAEYEAEIRRLRADMGEVQAAREAEGRGREAAERKHEDYEAELRKLRQEREVLEREGEELQRMVEESHRVGEEKVRRSAADTAKVWEERLAKARSELEALRAKGATDEAQRRELEAALERERSNILLVRADLEGTRDERMGLQAALDQERSSFRIVQDDLAAARSEGELLRAEREELELRVEQESNALRSLQLEIDALRAERDEILAREKLHTDVEARTLQDLRRRLESAEAERAELEEALEQEQNGTRRLRLENDAVRAECDELTAREKLHSDLEARSLQDLRKQLESAETGLRESEAEKDGILHQLEKELGHVRMLQLELDTEKAEREEAIARDRLHLDEEKAKERILKMELEALQAEHAEKDARNLLHSDESKTELEREVRELRGQNEQLKRERVSVAGLLPGDVSRRPSTAASPLERPRRQTTAQFGSFGRSTDFGIRSSFQTATNDRRSMAVDLRGDDASSIASLTPAALPPVRTLEIDMTADSEEPSPVREPPPATGGGGGRFQFDMTDDAEARSHATTSEQAGSEIYEMDLGMHRS